MAIALYTLLNDKSDVEVDCLINQVNRSILLRHFSLFITREITLSNQLFILIINVEKHLINRENNIDLCPIISC